MALKDLTVAAVNAALAEHDQIGAPAFREKYGFDPSWKYALVRDGKSYDSKAVAGAAHGYVGPDWSALPATEFAAGKDHAVKYLRRLGFEVPDAPRNGAWSRDELILALDLYMTTPASPPGKASPPWWSFHSFSISLAASPAPPRRARTAIPTASISR